MSKEKFDTKKWMHKQKKKMSTMHFWMKRLPIIGWVRIYNSSFFVSDLIAGLTVGLTVIPQGMACAVVAGLPPQVYVYLNLLQLNKLCLIKDNEALIGA